MSSPTQRTLARLRKDGYVAAVVEKWNPHAKIRQDLFRVVDVLAIRENETLAVQACSYTDVSRRVKKIENSDHIGDIRKAGWRFEVHGWKKNPNGRYSVRVVDVS